MILFVTKRILIPEMHKAAHPILLRFVREEVAKLDHIFDFRNIKIQNAYHQFFLRVRNRSTTGTVTLRSL